MVAALVALPIAAGGQGRSGGRQGPGGTPPGGAAPRGAPPPVARPAPPHPVHRAPSPVVRGTVFIGGYYYDPFYGPYPWWPRPAYPYWYFPIYDTRADVRIQVVPDAADDAAVYVDSFYAGIVNDFDGVFQSLPLTPGGHSIVLYLEGYRTVRSNFYLSPGSTFRLRATMERLPPGERSEPPEVSPPVPAPAEGSYKLPVTPSRATLAPGATPQAAGFGTLDLFVQPANAEVLIDGQPWVTTEDGHFVVQVPAGKHRLEIKRPGYRSFSREFDVREGEATPLNVSLLVTTS